MSKASPARKQRRQAQARILAKLGMTRYEALNSVNAASVLLDVLNGKPE